MRGLLEARGSRCETTVKEVNPKVKSRDGTVHIKPHWDGGAAASCQVQEAVCTTSGQVQ